MHVKQVAFAAREDYEGLSGTVSVADGKTFDVGAALEEGGGTIVAVAGSDLDHSLRGYNALRSVDVPAGAVAVNAAEAEGQAGVEVNASEAAIRKAAELEVDLDKVDGTGSGEKITVDDVKAAAEAAATSEDGDNGQED